MRIVIDAQIVKGYFQEIMGISQSDLTGEATPIFNRIGQTDHVYLDENGQIKNEWRNTVDPDWFEAWYPTLLRDGGAYEIPIQTCEHIKKRLISFGFPSRGSSSKDIWYVRVGKAVTNLFSRTIIITEDLHFYDPPKKGCSSKERMKILHSGRGPVSNYLERNENIGIRCVANYP